MSKLIYRYLKLYKKEAVIGPIAKLTEAVFELIVPIVMSKIIDIGIAGADIKYVLKMGGVLLLLGVLGLCFALICQYFASKASQGVGTALRNDLFRHINSLSAAEIDKIGASTLITRINSDVNQVQLSVAMLIRLAVRAPFLIIGSTVAAIIIDPKLSLIFLAATPLLAAVLFLVTKYSTPFYKSIQKKLDRVTLITKENLSGARVIRAFSKQKDEEQRFENAASELADVSMSVGKISALLSPLTFIIMNTAIIFIIWFGGKRVYVGDFTQGEIIAFVNYITQIMLAMVVLANVIVIITKASASAARIEEIFSAKPGIVQGTDENISLNRNNPAVEFKNVSFSYNKGKEKSVLENISFTVEPGQRVGIIGGTGSGKSTLVNLIPRFYDADEGSVTVFGNNVKDYPFKRLRSVVSVVPQKSVLFSGTVRDNMKLGNKEISDEDILRALDIAQAREFVEKLENGLDYIIERGGANLSGGQKQRLAIARAVAAKPDILILDDSSSALDFATEAKLRHGLASLSDTAVITTTQRVSCVMHCDKIIVIDDGKIVGMGTHGELIKSCGVYKEICASQFKETEAAI
ncbi:MAG: ABC transporter ATP-binding protein [Oscillospiraceae bacterium]|nr:ABC transporter ATP-binding protein [Oscillospiraceae bacterium]